MELKTKLLVEPGKQEILITRDFEIPVESLYTAYVEPAIIEQWMGTKVMKLDCKRYGSFHFVTTDPMGNEHHFSGTIHDCEPNMKITRTFEMEQTPFAVQLEYLEFIPIDESNSRLVMQIVFKSIEMRDNLLKMPFAQGLNMAHNRLELTLKNKSK